MNARVPALLMLSATSLAWTWDAALAPSGSSLTWDMCQGEFTASEETEIELAANSWDAGSGEVMRGAIWNFSRGSDDVSCAPDNNDNEVYSRSRQWFTSRGWPSSTLALCSRTGNDIDISFVQDVTWSTAVPSGTSNTSIGQTALHEFGHALGFNHENTVVATMNASYPFGGDISAHKYRPHENDYAGLVANRPGASTGTNLLLGRFLFAGTSAQELWDQKVFADWTVCDGVVSSPNGPDEIYAIIEGTSSQSPLIEWWLSEDTDCDAGTRYDVGSRTPTISSGTPYLVHPNPYDFTGVPTGHYYLCAEIDPNGLIAETPPSDSDNNLVSEVEVTVQGCP